MPQMEVPTAKTTVQTAYQCYLKVSKQFLDAPDICC